MNAGYTFSTSSVAFLRLFKKIYSLSDKTSPKKVNLKELQPLYFKPFSSSVTLFYAQRICVITTALLDAVKHRHRAQLR
jgi:hypothetical protein